MPLFNLSNFDLVKISSQLLLLAFLAFLAFLFVLTGCSLVARWLLAGCSFPWYAAQLVIEIIRNFGFARCSIWRSFSKNFNARSIKLRFSPVLLTNWSLPVMKEPAGIINLLLLKIIEASF
jgi:hypothetical protein